MSPQPEKPSELISPATPQNEFSSEERKLLLRLAHDSIAAALEPRDLPASAPTAHLGELRGAFTTLYLYGGLRGCVGYVMPVTPLYRTVIETAQSAAFEDTRFWPVTGDEVALLEISLSILSRLEPIRAGEIEVGRHGLLISLGSQRGLLLPQVAVEHGWDRITFLEQTCRKAGLPPDSWQTAKLEAFTAEIFGDQDFAT